MFDLKWLRDHPDAFDASLARRGQPPAAASILALDTERRRIDARLQEELAERNELSRRIGALKVKGQNAEEPLRRVATLKDGIKAGEDELRAAQARLDAALATYPNLLAAEVPDGKDERNNVELRRWGTPRRAEFPLRSHEEVGATLGMDFERAAKLSGSRFVVLWGQLARLERALAQFMLDLHTREHGYTEVSAPVMVRDAALFGTSQLPKFADDLFHLTSGHWLIPTAEVSLTNLMAAEIVDQTHLPLRMTAGTLCFRSEAGAAGKDTKGMLRQHQFQKIELVSITAPERSVEEHERMTGCAEAVLQRLGVPYRVVLLCAGDTGFGSTKTYDIEAWLPGQMTYREISSCSNCGDFQARRMAARYRPADGKGTRFVHTLNGSGVAVGRALIAVLENYQEADGAVTIPEALRPYMGGEQWLAPAHG